MGLGLIYTVFYLVPGVEKLGGRIASVLSTGRYIPFSVGFLTVWLIVSVLLVKFSRRVSASSLHRVNPTFIRVLPIVLCALFCVVFSFLAYQRHTSFRTGLYDLGLEHQVVWNSSEGRWFQSSVEVDNYLGDHFSPLVAVVAVVYKFLPSVVTLFVIQALAVSVSAYGIYRLAYYVLKRRLYSLVILGLFLAYWGIYGLMMFDFHPIVLAMPLLVWGIYLIVKEKRFWLAAILFVLATLAKEDVGIFVFGVGVYLAIFRKQKRGWLLALYSFVISIVALFVVIPAFRGASSDTLARYGVWSNLLKDPISTLAVLINYEHIQYFVRWLLPLGFVSLWAPQIMFVILPSFLINFLSDYSGQLSLINHYDVMTTIGVFWALIIAWQPFQRWWRKQFVGLSPRPQVMFVGLLVMLNAAILISHPVIRDFQTYSNRRELFPAVNQLRQIIPHDAVVLSTNRVGAHFGDRRELQALGIGERVYTKLPDWILVDTLDQELNTDAQEKLNEIFTLRSYEQVVNMPNLKVYKAN